jgi:hypothetical protein
LESWQEKLKTFHEEKKVLSKEIKAKEDQCLQIVYERLTLFKQNGMLHTKWEKIQKERELLSNQIEAREKHLRQIDGELQLIREQIRIKEGQLLQLKRVVNGKLNAKWQKIDGERKILDEKVMLLKKEYNFSCSCPDEYEYECFLGEDITCSCRIYRDAQMLALEDKKETLVGEEDLQDFLLDQHKLLLEERDALEKNLVKDEQMEKKIKALSEQIEVVGKLLQTFCEEDIIKIQIHDKVEEISGWESKESRERPNGLFKLSKNLTTNKSKCDSCEKELHDLESRLETTKKLLPKEYPNDAMKWKCETPVQVQFEDGQKERFKKMFANGNSVIVTWNDGCHDIQVKYYNDHLSQMIPHRSCHHYVKEYFDYVTFYFELKPMMGDDYPCVLRKLKTQKERTKTSMLVNGREPTKAKDFEMEQGNKNRRGNWPIFGLLVGQFQSATTTKEQLVEIFTKQHGIEVVFLDEILPSSDSSLIPIRKDRVEQVTNNLLGLSAQEYKEVMRLYDERIKANLVT